MPRRHVAWHRARARLSSVEEGALPPRLPQLADFAVVPKLSVDPTLTSTFVSLSFELRYCAYVRTPTSLSHSYFVCEGLELAPPHSSPDATHLAPNMSQRSRPGSAQALADQQRMSFTAAEALLWGKRTAEEHHHISSRMRDLEEQHQAYHSRIQATETVAEAAEAATARIRRIEHQIAAIESDEQDRPFDKWVEGEVSTFKVFAEKNKNVRQKQIELEGKISCLEDSVDKAKDVALDLEILLERIARLENDRNKDASLIRKLESEVSDVKVVRQSKAIVGTHMPPPSTGRATPKQMCPPPSAQPVAEVDDAADETEDEEILATQPVIHPQQYPVEKPLSSVTIPKSMSTITSSSPKKKGRDEMSARLRVMQRNSIHDPKYTLEDEPRMDHTPTVRMNPPLHPRSAPLPATQMVERSDPQNLVPLDKDMPGSPPKRQPAKQLVVKLNVRKRKVEDIAPKPRLTRSQAKKINESNHAVFEVPQPKEVVGSGETQLVNEPAAKRRKPNVTRPPPQSQPRAKVKAAKKPAHATQNAANLVKTVPRKTAAASKRTKPAAAPVQPTAENPASPEKKKVSKAKTSTRPKKYDDGSDAYPKEAGSSVPRIPGPSKPASSTSYMHREAPYTTPGVDEGPTSETMGPPFSRRGPATSSRGSRRPPLISPVTLDQATYERMKKQSNLII
ncbi:hypothetical protein HBI21_022420 [Parastagonospora nodorum]|nr:hypothetical protein HBI21_022420 [Parastagonospora nodorum]